MSDIFTVSDEAFALLILLNEYHCWDENNKEEKRFVSAKSGNQQGWTTAGINAYNTLCKNIKARRLEEGSKKLEEIIRAEYAGTISSTRRLGSTVEEVVFSDFEDDNENQRLDVAMRAQELEEDNEDSEHDRALLEQV